MLEVFFWDFSIAFSKGLLMIKSHLLLIPFFVASSFFSVAFSGKTLDDALLKSVQKSTIPM